MVRILAIDDDVSFLTAFKTILCEAGHEVVFSDTVTSAISIAGGAKAPELCVFDVAFPLKDGLQRAAELKQAFSQARLLAVSEVWGEGGSEGDQEFVRQMGVDALLAKPISKEVLLSRVAALLENTYHAPEANSTDESNTESGNEEDVSLAPAAPHYGGNTLAELIGNGLAPNVQALVGGKALGRMLQAYFEKHASLSSYQLECFETSESLYARLNQEDKGRDQVPAVLLLDGNHADEDCIEMICEIKGSESWGYLPILLMAHGLTDKQLDGAVESGADCCLKKPFSAEELALRIEELLLKVYA